MCICQFWRAYRLYLSSLASATELAARGVPHIEHGGQYQYYEDILVAGGLLNRLQRRRVAAPIQDDLGDLPLDDGEDGRSDGSDESSSSSSSNGSSSSNFDSSADHGDDDEGNSNGDVGDKGIEFLRKRFNTKPSSLNHSWPTPDGPFKFTIKASSASGSSYSWQAFCPYHRTSQSTFCKTSLRIPVVSLEGDENLKKVNDTLRLLKTWCCVATEFDRRWKHWGFMPASALPDHVLEEQCPIEAPPMELVLDDTTLDAVQGQESDNPDGGLELPHSDLSSSVGEDEKASVESYDDLDLD